MNNSFSKFCTVWKELAGRGRKEINEATLLFFLTKHFGVSKMSIAHYTDLSLRFGFISLNKNNTYSVHRDVIERAFKSGEK